MKWMNIISGIRVRAVRISKNLYKQLLNLIDWANLLQKRRRNFCKLNDTSKNNKKFVQLLYNN